MRLRLPWLSLFLIPLDLYALGPQAPVSPSSIAPAKSLSQVLAPAAAPKTGDPFAGIESYSLSNGLSVILFPKSGEEQALVAFEVEAGANDETREIRGIAHLVEHSVYRDISLGNQSYLDVLRQAGADTNGYTFPDQTEFFASVSAEKVDWLLSEFSQLLRPRKIDPKLLEMAKTEISLELGTRSLQAGKNSGQGILEMKLWNDEFGLPQQDPGDGSAKAALHRLTTAQVQNFFDKYYHPKNMTLFVVGKFDDTRLRKLIQDDFGAWSSEGKHVRLERVAHLKETPSYDARVTPTVPIIIEGTKLWKNTAKDEMVLRSYLLDLSLRLMEKIRSQEAQTYTVAQDVMMDTRGFGIGIMTFQTPDKDFDANLGEMLGHMDDEARDGQFTNEQIEKAKKVYFSQAEAFEGGTKALLKRAQLFDAFKRTYGGTADPYQVLASTTPAEYRGSLKQVFNPDREFRTLLTPPLFFKLEGLIFSILAFFLARFYCRQMFYVEANEKLPYDFEFKVKLSWTMRGLKWLVFILAFIGWGATCYGLLKMGNGGTSSYRVLVTEWYLRNNALFALLVLVVSFINSRYPKFVRLSQDYLIVKNGSFSSRRFPVKALQGVELTRGLRGALTLRRRRFLNFSFMAPGVIIRFKDGSGYVLGAQFPEQVVQRLQAACSSAPANSTNQTVRERIVS